MLDSKDVVLDGHTYSIRVLPAMQALKLLPLVGKAFKNAGSGAAFEELSESEMDKLARTLLASSKCDGKDLMPAIDLLLAGKVQILVQLLAFAIKSNYSDFGAAPADTDPQPGA